MSKVVILKKKRIFIIMLTFFIVVSLIFVCFKMNKKKENAVDDVINKLYFENISNKKEVGKLVLIDEIHSNVSYKVNYPVLGNDKIDSIIVKEVDKIITNNDKKYLCNCPSVNYYFLMNYESYIVGKSYVNILLNEVFEDKDLNLVEKKSYSYLFDITNGKLLKNEEVFKNEFYDYLKSNLKKEEITNNLIYVINDEKLVLLDYDVEISLEDIGKYFFIDVVSDRDYASKDVETEYVILNKEKNVTSTTLLYSKDSNDSDSIGKIEKDSKVKVFSESDKGWSILFYEDRIVFVESKYLSEIKKEENVDNGNFTEKRTMYAIIDVNIRSEANSNSEKLGELKTGESIEKIGEEGSWTKVLYEGEIAYISSSCLSSVKIKKREVKLNVPPQGNIDVNKPMVALTFDDGPNPVSTPLILNTLEKYNVHATFFDLGSLMKKYPAVVQREAQLGEVGTHTYSHKNLNKLSINEIEQELKLSRETYKNVLGYDPILLRPPYGNINATARALVDMPIIQWDVDSLDWKYRNKDLILNEIDKYGNLDGRIILMHSIYTSTADAVEILVPDLIDRGYQIVSVSELASYRGYTLETGTIYHHFK
ncbi:MAG: polysaccharide deacetylase family protein [Candidatus Coprovivens sp.]